MRYLIMFLLRLMFMIISVPVMALTAAIEYGSVDPDWKYWREFNEPLMNSLPWAKYR